MIRRRATESHGGIGMDPTGLVTSCHFPNAAIIFLDLNDGGTMGMLRQPHILKAGWICFAENMFVDAKFVVNR